MCREQSSGLAPVRSGCQFVKAGLAPSAVAFVQRGEGFARLGKGLLVAGGVAGCAFDHAQRLTGEEAFERRALVGLHDGPAFVRVAARLGEVAGLQPDLF